jgi:hypothetical protein
MKHAAKMGSGGMIYVPSFTKIGLDIQKLLGAGYSQTYKQDGDRISILQESRLKTEQIHKNRYAVRMFL